MSSTSESKRKKLVGSIKKGCKSISRIFKTNSSHSSRSSSPAPENAGHDKVETSKRDTNTSNEAPTTVPARTTPAPPTIEAQEPAAGYDNISSTIPSTEAPLPLPTIEPMDHAEPNTSSFDSNNPLGCAVSQEDSTPSSTADSSFKKYKIGDAYVKAYDKLSAYVTRKGPGFKASTTTVLRLLNEAADGFPPLKSAVGGLVAVIDLVEKTQLNRSDTKKQLERIAGLSEVFTDWVEKYSVGEEDIQPLIV
jgi:hypothetical protein